jgi:hypothetical protein
MMRVYEVGREYFYSFPPEKPDMQAFPASGLSKSFMNYSLS